MASSAFLARSWHTSTHTTTALGYNLRTAVRRTYASGSKAFRGSFVMNKILDTYIPPKSLPLPTSRPNFLVLWNRFKHFALTNWSVYLLRKSGTGWTVPQFTKDAEAMYIDMNREFANGNKDALSKYVTDGFLAMLNPEMKAMKSLGKCVWKSFGSAERPRLMNMTTQRLSVELNSERRLTQATVRVNITQSMCIVKDGKVIGGDPNEQKSIPEYIVLERWLDGPHAEKGWRIVGKIQPEIPEIPTKPASSTIAAKHATA